MGKLKKAVGEHGDSGLCSSRFQSANTISYIDTAIFITEHELSSDPLVNDDDDRAFHI
ncbi:hypothetical protein CCACVL1_12545 [Corchorus capsularis]|uniref:Uncharacterized protein n=1 Tax=Corchorus capsularis TaxID=210143 RepID=A0A1R3IF41_COCAP|nr:hypothetical protein CCACVL1_12545 [Corchorus capsularis]